MRCKHCFYEFESSNTCPKCRRKPDDGAQEFYYLTPGSVLGGRYAVGEVLGVGGFGIVYKAWDNVANQVVAIKEYYPAGLVSRDLDTGDVILIVKQREREYLAGAERFIQEREGALRLDKTYPDNPCIVHEIDERDENETHYMIMEYVEGDTLTVAVERNGPMPAELALNFTKNLIKTVGDIHKLGIIHRDISPDNILMTGEEPKLIDFGAAKFGRRSSDKNAERIMKPGFSPPEQYELNDRTGVHTDIYALGATMYFALTGHRPNESTDRKSTGEDLLASPKSLNPDIPEHISDAILKAMAIDSRLRFKSAIDFLNSIEGKKKVKRPEVEKKARQLRRLVSISATLIILIIAGAFTYLRTMDQVPILADAQFEMWIMLTDNEHDNAQRLSSMERVLERFTTLYPNVEIALQGIRYDVFHGQVTRALEDGRPVIFESGAFSQADLASAADISAVMGRVNNVLFLDDLTRLHPVVNRIPTGFRPFGIFINSSLATYAELSVSDLSSLLATMGAGSDSIAVFSRDDTEFINTFGNVTRLPSDAFFTESAGALFADTSVLPDVQMAFAGRYRLLRLDTAEVPAIFGGMFSVAQSSRNEVAAKARLVEFMLSENAQDMMHIQTASGLIPINERALQTFSDVFADFLVFFDYIENYVFIVREGN